MPLLQLIGVLIAVAVIYWLIEIYVPANRIKTILQAVIVIAVVLWLLGLFFPGIGAIRVGR
jgi:hypothetical protein